MRCPHCQASNPDTAVFCGQCFERFDTAAAEPEAAPAGTDRPQPGGAGAGTAVAGRFSAVDGALTWRCALCDATNDLSAFSCSVCGAKMDAETDAAAVVDWPAARRAESLMPGLGHLRVGLTGMGVARTGTVGLWLVLVLLLSLSGGAGLVTALPLLIGIAAIWVTGPGDLDAARTGRRPRLDARGFMYLVTGVILGVIVAGGVSLIL